MSFDFDVILDLSSMCVQLKDSSANDRSLHIGNPSRHRQGMPPDFERKFHDSNPLDDHFDGTCSEDWKVRTLINIVVDM